MGESQKSEGLAQHFVSQSNGLVGLVR